MLFNSATFFGFFALFYPTYLILARWPKLQNLALLAGSYIFYGFWDWRFLLLIGLTTVTDYTVSIFLDQINRKENRHIFWRRGLLFLSLAVDLTILGFFKYFNFFSNSLVKLIGMVGIEVDPITLNLILPIGISFYTFKSISYTIDVYRGQQKPAGSLLDYAIFVAFFPQLVAGPIDRAGRMLPQIVQSRQIRLEQLGSGVYLILWGFFQKAFVADNLGLVANKVFDPSASYAGIDILLGVLAFTIQIYADFSGYSDIGRGVARLLGFETMINFRLPYFALNPTDFWQRWHISLSEWLRDYIFFPLRRWLLRRRSNEETRWSFIIPPLVTMLISGLWHGAGWTFILWGAYHGVLMVLYRAYEKRPAHQDSYRNQFNPVEVATRMGLMFLLVAFGWLLFRAVSVDQVLSMFSNLSLTPSANSLLFLQDLAFFTFPFLLVQLLQHWRGDLLVLARLPALPRLAVYLGMLTWIVIFGPRASVEFIYFQF